ncbi:unnamed protein product [Medioppia subpectinata]|uniref:Uncharacterized protein n=1 Tax=Medioppia subpectinata TaxID=1979941 RepID=A0A7R9KPA4_9ACAR|nr:unnamed protein product [Medioppia subpectinata]CAG2106016.1 unnamed protein product [Medioppia subpectinata]
MDSMKIWTNWVTTKSIDSSVFVRYIGADGGAAGGRQDSGSSGDSTDEDTAEEDVESLLESCENCVQLSAPTTTSDTTARIECKLFVQTLDDGGADGAEDVVTRVDSYSLLCSAKVLEIHGNDTQEYIQTVFNELVDECDGLSMYRSDYHFKEPLKEFTITFKSFNELWIYGLVVRLIRVKQSSVVKPSGDHSGIGSLFGMLSMFGKASNASSALSPELMARLAALKTTGDSVVQKDTASSDSKCRPSAQLIAIKMALICGDISTKSLHN